MLLKNTDHILTVTDMGYTGEGIARVSDGMAVFVKGALPGERVKARITAVKSGYAYARLLAVTAASPDRVAPPCPVFGKCGGCGLQHLSYPAQLAYKKKLVRDTIEKYAGVRLTVADCVPSPREYRYRNKAQIPVALDKDGAFVCGFYRANSHDIVDIADCLLHPDWFKPALAVFRAYLNQNRIKLIDKNTGTSVVRHFIARELAGSPVFTIVTNNAGLPRLMPLYEALRAVTGGNTGLYLNLNTREDNVILSESFVHIAGEKPSAHPASFAQVNDGVRDRIYADLCVHAGREKADVLVDAYAGAGRLTAMLSAHAGKVYGIEINRNAVADADAYLRTEGIGNVVNLAGDTAQELPKLAGELAGKRSVIVLDPPRKGCARSVLDAVADSGAARVCYISCNPATLARDLKHLSAHYTPVSVTPYDMFPQTANVEVLAVIGNNDK